MYWKNGKLINKVWQNIYLKEKSFQFIIQFIFQFIFSIFQFFNFCLKLQYSIYLEKKKKENKKREKKPPFTYSENYYIILKCKLLCIIERKKEYQLYKHFFLKKKSMLGKLFTPLLFSSLHFSSLLISTLPFLSLLVSSFLLLILSYLFS